MQQYPTVDTGNYQLTNIIQMLEFIRSLLYLDHLLVCTIPLQTNKKKEAADSSLLL